LLVGTVDVDDVHAQHVVDEPVLSTRRARERRRAGQHGRDHGPELVVVVDGEVDGCCRRLARQVG
jgi:hypothetical protein